MSDLIINEVQRKLPSDELWNHPALALFSRPVAPEKTPDQPPRLFLIPTTYGDHYEQDFAPLPTPKSELPELMPWVKRLVVSLIEIWSGRRSPIQISRWCHRLIYQEVVRGIGRVKPLPKLRKIYINEPIEGVGEVTVTLRCGERIRSLVMRIEGVDHRWICTELFLI